MGLIAMATPKLRALILLYVFIAISSLITTARACKNQTDAPPTESPYDDGSTPAESPHGEGSLKTDQCSPECSRRCEKTHHKKPCLFFCKKCCKKCLCVPPGYYGNKEVCPCYNDWKTKRGGPKCP